MSEHCTVPLTRGFCAKVDLEDFADLSQYKWSLAPGTRTNYAARGVGIPGTRKVMQISMHRQIMGLNKNSDPKFTVDHINGDGLDNRKCNLRLATRQQQAMNRPIRSDNKSGYPGVYWLWTNEEKTKGKWRALIRVEGKRLSLGLFDDVEEAADAYMSAAVKYFGEWMRDDQR